MPRMPGRRIPFLPRSEREDEEHLDALLEELPEVDPEPMLPFGAGGAREAGPEDLDDLVRSLDAETQIFVSAQFARLRARLDASAPSARELAEARALIAGLREENARLLRQLDLYERAFRSVKELASDVEEASR